MYFVKHDCISEIYLILSYLMTPGSESATYDDENDDYYGNEGALSCEFAMAT